MVTDQLLDEIVDEAIHAFSTVVSAHPGEHFCAFALYSDDDGCTIVPSSNSTEGVQRRVAFYQGRMSAAEIAVATPEWAFEAKPRGAMREVCKQLSGLTSSFEGDEFEWHVGEVWGAMLVALHRHMAALPALCEGRRPFLMCSVSDSDDATWLEHESSRLLNDPAAHAQAFAVWPEDAHTELSSQLAQPGLRQRAFWEFSARHGIARE